MKLLAFVAVAALVGCGRNDKTATEQPVGTATVTMAPITLAGPSDEELDRRANAAIRAQPFIATEGEGVAVAGIVASHVPGVMETVNDVAFPFHPFSVPEGDDRIQFHIQMALLRDAELVDHASDIDVQVDHGVVTLEGIATPAARASAERIASHQSGVVTVDNRMRIGPTRPPTGRR